MKEILAIVRPNKTSDTKEALEKAGFPAYTCTKVRGRGKKPYNFAGDISENARHRLLPKRLITVIVSDQQAQKVVEVIAKANRTKMPGDGKIFVMPITESYQVRNGEGGADAY
ncbi:MAG: P-II family nitrogen regulator [Anaerostipes sp.]|nr:P-II family nitrogen regulator [Anaerostipes sp.]